MTGEGHHDLGRHSLFKGVDDEGSSCGERTYHIAKGAGLNHSINSVPLHLGHLAGKSQNLGDFSHAQCTWTTALGDTFVYTARRKQASAGDYRRSVHIIESTVRSVRTLCTSASQTYVFHTFVAHNIVEAWAAFWSIGSIACKKKTVR